MAKGRGKMKRRRRNKTRKWKRRKHGTITAAKNSNINKAENTGHLLGENKYRQKLLTKTRSTGVINLGRIKWRLVNRNDRYITGYRDVQTSNDLLESKTEYEDNIEGASTQLTSVRIKRHRETVTKNSDSRQHKSTQSHLKASNLKREKLTLYTII
jgi:hypothetical protein